MSISAANEVPPRAANIHFGLALDAIHFVRFQHRYFEHVFGLYPLDRGLDHCLVFRQAPVRLLQALFLGCDDVIHILFGEKHFRCHELRLRAASWGASIIGGRQFR
jgi:hypothetical protein